ncbi:hypothetical protein [Rhodosalinus sp.]|uniref:hypothetical protein n=1 Tax=Rhodosalinus sp. TaxID=2047741 RepID=UPI00397AC7D5
MAQIEFDERLRRIQRRNRRLSRGAVPYIDSTGLVTFRPKRRGLRLPLRGLLLVAAGFVVFKGLVLAHLGQELYEDRLALLRSGTVIEQGGAWAMEIDPATEWVAAQLWPFLN